MALVAAAAVAGFYGGRRALVEAPAKGSEAGGNRAGAAAETSDTAPETGEGGVR